MTSEAFIFFPLAAFSCANNPDGVTLRLFCPNCTAARENYLANSEFLDLVSPLSEAFRGVLTRFSRPCGKCISRL